MKIQRNTAGFTLVEIMIVVAIIGLLAAIAVPNFVQARATAKKNACINNLRLISAAKDQGALDNTWDEDKTPSFAELSPYLKTTPVCPQAGAYDNAAVSANPSCDVAGHSL